MKLGTENRTTTILAVALFAIAVILLVRMFTAGGQPAAAATPSVPQAAAGAPASPPPPTRARRSVRGRAAGTRNANTGPVISLDPRLRLDLLRQSEETEYKGAGRNIFRAEAEIPKPVASAVTEQAKNAPPPPPPGPPPPPPINLKFFGFASGSGEPTKVFLGNGDDVFVAGEGDIVNRRYRIMKIHSNSVEIEDVLSNNRQTIPLTAG